MEKDIIEVLAKKIAEMVLDSIKPMLASTQQKPLTRDQLMKQLDISAATLWKWEKQGKIHRAFTLGKRPYYYLPN